MTDKAQSRSESPLAPQFPLSVLIVEDNPDDAELNLRVLRKAQFEVQYKVVQTAAEFMEELRNGSYDVILSDYNLGPWNGLDALELLQRTPYNIPFILVTGALGEARAVECFKFGITDYVLKDRIERLPVAVFRALEENALRNEARQAERMLKESEAKFRALVDAIPIALFIERGTQCRYANRAAEEITGYSRTELLDKNFWELMLPGSRKALLRQRLKQGDQSEVPTRYQARILSKAGQVRVLDVTVGTFALDGGLAALISAADVTPSQSSRHRFDWDTATRHPGDTRFDELSVPSSAARERPN